MAEPSTIKGCINCVHCKGEDLFLLCHHPDYSYQTKDYINGVIHTNYPLCVMVRDNQELCGDSARGWQENPQKEPEYHPNLWSAFRGLVKDLF